MHRSSVSIEDYRLYFRLLGLPLHATADEIQKAFRQRVKEIHPDRRPESEKKKANQEFIQLKQAQEILLERTQEAIPSSPLEVSSGNVFDVKPGDITEHHTVTSAKFINEAVAQDARIDLKANNIHIPNDLGLDQEYTFYVSFPFLKTFSCDPFNVLANIRSAKARHTEIFSDKKEALQSLNGVGEISLSGEIDLAISQMQQLHMAPYGIVYTLVTTPRTIINCYGKGEFHLFAPMIKGYCYYKSQKENSILAVNTRDLIVEIRKLHTEKNAKDCSEETKKIVDEKIKTKNQELRKLIRELHGILFSDKDPDPDDRVLVENEIPLNIIEKLMQELMQTDEDWKIQLTRHDAFISENIECIRAQRFTDFNSQLDLFVNRLADSYRNGSQLFNPQTCISDVNLIKHFKTQINSVTSDWASLCKLSQDYYARLATPEIKREFLAYLNAHEVLVHNDSGLVVSLDLRQT